MKLFRKNQRGFTLIELLIVIAIIAILAAIVLIAINPARQFSQANNTARSSGVLTIINAVHQYAIDNRGLLFSGILANGPYGTPVCKLASPAAAGCANLANIGSVSYNQLYVASIPLDPGCPASCGDNVPGLPQLANPNSTGYRIYKSANGRVTVFAPNAELGATISVTR